MNKWRFEMLLLGDRLRDDWKALRVLGLGRFVYSTFFYRMHMRWLHKHSNAHRGQVMPTTLQYRQTAERVRKNVAAMREELNRQSRRGCDTLADIDLRALYLVTDERAAKVYGAACEMMNCEEPSPTPQKRKDEE